MSATQERLQFLTDSLDTFTAFLKPYKHLLASHNVQFLVDNFWTKESLLSSALRNDLDAFIISHTSPDAPINLVKHYVEVTSTNETEYSHLDGLFLEINSLIKKWNKDVLTPIERLLNADLTTKYESTFSRIKKQNRFMNQKKVHEVDFMSKFVAELCESRGIQNIVDIGSGRAYLSSQLSSSFFEPPFNVIAIDSQQTNVSSSLKRLTTMKKQTNFFPSGQTQQQQQEQHNTEPNFKTFKQFIQSSSQLTSLIQAHLTTTAAPSQFSLIGLHSCGNLSNSIVNLYATSNDSRLLCNVACCYNLLNEKYVENVVENSVDIKNTQLLIDEASKFPMSGHLNELEYSLGYDLRMLACHSFDRLLASCEEFRELSNTSQWYRCVLQEILVTVFGGCEEFRQRFEVLKDPSGEANPKNVKIGRRLINDKVSASTSGFVEYVRKALERLELSNEKLSDAEILEFWTRSLCMKRKFDVYVQLKIVFSSIIEYIILLDRLVYLHEIEAKCKIAKEDSHLSNQHYLVKIFDSNISPRCHAMVSFK